MIHDWSDVSARDAAQLFAVERERWREQLAWETATTWRLIDAARSNRTLPGLVVRGADGVIRGWSFYLLHCDTLQIGALNARDSDATDTLLTAILQSADARLATRAVVFTLSNAPGLVRALESRGFSVADYYYLARELNSSAATPHLGRALGKRVPCDFAQARSGDPSTSLRGGDRRRYGEANAGHDEEAGSGQAPSSENSTPAPGTGYPAPGTFRHWRSQDTPAAARLMGAAYPANEPMRPFAGRGTEPEWRDYVRQLTTTAGCGTFAPHLSLVAPGAQELLDGVALVSDLGEGTAHLAQIVVSPAVQRAGLGRRLLCRALDTAGHAGFARMTLLVSDHNKTAQTLYSAAGFRARASFLCATSPMPVEGRSTIPPDARRSPVAVEAGF